MKPKTFPTHSEALAYAERAIASGLRAVLCETGLGGWMVRVWSPHGDWAKTARVKGEQA